VVGYRAKQSTRYLEEALQQATVGLSARDTDAVKELVNDYTPRCVLERKRKELGLHCHSNSK